MPQEIILGDACVKGGFSKPAAGSRCCHDVVLTDGGWVRVSGKGKGPRKLRDALPDLNRRRASVADAGMASVRVRAAESGHVFRGGREMRWRPPPPTGHTSYAPSGSRAPQDKAHTGEKSGHPRRGGRVIFCHSRVIVIEREKQGFNQTRRQRLC